MDTDKGSNTGESEQILSAKELIIILWSNKLLIGIAGVLGFISIFFVTSLQNEYYEVRSTLSSSEFAEVEIMPRLRALTDDVQEGLTDELSRQFEITELECEAINDIDFTGSRANGELFTVEMVLNVSDTTIINEVHNGILNQLHNNAYLKRRLELRRESLKSLKKANEEELADLQKFKEETTELGEKIQAGIVVYPLNIHTEIIHIHQRNIEIEQRLDLSSVAEFLQIGQVSDTPAGPNPIKNGIVGLLTAALLIVIYLILKRLVWEA